LICQIRNFFSQNDVFLGQGQDFENEPLEWNERGLETDEQQDLDSNERLVLCILFGFTTYQKCILDLLMPSWILSEPKEKKSAESNNLKVISGVGNMEMASEIPMPDFKQVCLSIILCTI